MAHSTLTDVTGYIRMAEDALIRARDGVGGQYANDQLCRAQEYIQKALDANQIDEDEDESSGCPECDRSFGPGYRGPCEH